MFTPNVNTNIICGRKRLSARRVTKRSIKKKHTTQKNMIRIVVIRKRRNEEEDPTIQQKKKRIRIGEKEMRHVTISEGQNLFGMEGREVISWSMNSKFKIPRVGERN